MLTKAILFFFGCSKVNSTWLITSKLANQPTQKACVVYTNYYHYCYFFLVSLDSRIRARVVNHLRPSFSTIAEAEAYYNLTLYDYLDELALGQTQLPAKKKTGFDKCMQTTFTSDDSTERPSSRVAIATLMESSTQTTDDEPIPIPAAPIQAAASEIPIMELAVNVTNGNLQLLLSQLCRSFSVTCLLDLVSKLAMLLSRNELVVCADKVFLHLTDLQGETCNPVNYVSLSLEAMKTLSVISKSNLICKFVYMLGTKCPGSEEPLMPINRMPFGLMQYQIEFFSSTNVMQVQ